MSGAEVIALAAGAGEAAAAAEQARAATGAYLDRCPLSANTVRAYRRQTAAYARWIADHPADHPDAFADTLGATAAVTAWRRHLLQSGIGPATVNQALAALTLLYEHGAGLRIDVKRARLPRPGEPEALTVREQNRLQRAADRRGARDAALVALLLYTGARAAEAARLQTEDVAVTARTGTVRLLGKGEEVRTVPLPAPGRTRLAAWLRERGADPGPLWTGQRGPLSISGLTQAVLAAGADARMPGLRPHRLRHTYATRLRQDGADAAQIQALLGHAAAETTARYFRAGAAETAEAVERAFE